MNIIDEAAVLVRLARWGLALARHNIRYPSPVPDNPKFLSPRDAVGLIRNGAVVAASGLGAHQRASILYWALREAFAATGHPRRLTVINVGGHGGRGILPGSLDELAQAGLCARFITGHFETFRGMLDLAASGRCDLQCLPLGIIALLFDALGRGQDSIVTGTGVGTFLDPRVGRGTPVAGRKKEQLVSAVGGRLRYRLPKIDVALFNAPAADRRGNIFVKNCAIIGDSYEIARAAKRNGGLVIANVGLLVEEGYDRIFLPAGMVDAVVYYPDTEQTAGFFHHDPWLALTAGNTGGIREALDQARFARWLGEVAGGLARRTAVDEAVFRLAATTLVANAGKGARVVIGAGLPEDVARVIFESDRLSDFTFLVESGAVGGLPAPGAYFGSAFSPDEIVSTAQLFTRCYRRLDAACLGALEVDGNGNVNVSRRGPGVRQYAGPGGFIDFAAAAQTIIFLSSWMRDGELALEGDAVRLLRKGKPKFVRRVGEVCFNGAQALRAGKKVFYATPVGLFRLTAAGLELTAVMPGIDIRRDIIDVSAARIVIPPSDVERVPHAVVTGEGFTLRGQRSGANRDRPRRAKATRVVARARLRGRQMRPGQKFGSGRNDP